MTQRSQTGFDAGFVEDQMLRKSGPELHSIEMARGAYLFESFGNAGAVITEDGVFVIDTGNPLVPTTVLAPLRQLTDLPVRYILYTHGHADHAANAQPLLDEAERRGDPRPLIIAHRKVTDRLNRYRELHAQNDWINRLQLRLPPQHPGFPSDDRFIRPDITYDEKMSLQMGSYTFELHHAQGETDDITWLYIPQLKIIFSGDLFISSCPNIGNPLKLQRYEVEWATALEQMAALHVEVLGPGHGQVVRGVARIEDALLTTARALRMLHDEVARHLNLGHWEEQITHEVVLPAEIATHWAMAPIYGCPEFIVRAIYRRYAGWWNGNPSDLFPAPVAAIAREIVGLTGNKALIERAEALAQAGDLQMALHLVDFLLDGTSDIEIKRRALHLKVTVLQQRGEQEGSFISQSILSIAAERLQLSETDIAEAGSVPPLRL